MHTNITYRRLAGSGGFWTAVGLMALLTALGGLSAFYTEHSGHWVTGMSNTVPWGLPLVLATFLIVAASGALNVASVGSVFGKADYQPWGRISCLLAVALLAGGLPTLLLDLGRPDQVVVALTTFNFTSIFALNIFIYSGFFILVLGYIWASMEPRLAKAYKPVAVLAFLWRLTMTTGTGLIFGLLVPRQAFHSALLAPMFISLSLSVGLAAFILVKAAIERGQEQSPGLERRLRVLLAVLTLLTLYLVAVMHLGNLYWAERRDFENFILSDGGLLTFLFWGGFVTVGSLAPMALLLVPGLDRGRLATNVSAVMVLLGGVALIYVTVIGAQVFPLELFPGKEVMSNFFDGTVVGYSPAQPEIWLGLGGFGLAGVILMLGARVLPMVPVPAQANGKDRISH